MIKPPVIFAYQYWEAHWLYPLAKKTGWPVVESPHNIEFCRNNGLELISYNEAQRGYQKLVTCMMHYGGNKEAINHWRSTGGKVYIVQRAFDSALSVYNEFWGMNMGNFDKYLVCSEFDKTLLENKWGGGRIVNTGSPRLHMASEATKKDLSDIHDRVGTDKFFLATVIGGMPEHPDSVNKYYLNQLREDSPIRVVHKLHPGGTLEYFEEKHPGNFYWEDNRQDPWETYKLIAASQGVITPSSFVAIEATIMGKPVILKGDLDEEEYKRQSAQRQRERLPRSMSSTLENPTFTEKQRQIQDLYKYDKESINRVIREIVG